MLVQSHGIGALALGVVLTAGQAVSQNLDHRQTQTVVRVDGLNGQAVSGATVNLTMLKHDFRWGTQIHSADYLNNSSLRNTVHQYFNSVTLTNGLHWKINETNQNNQTHNFYAAADLAMDHGLKVRGHAVLWPHNQQWLNPGDVLPNQTYGGSNGNTLVSNPGYNASAANLKARIDARIADVMFQTTAAGNAYGVTITEFDATNEVWDRNTTDATDIFTPRLVQAGYYASKVEAVADWYKQMKAARPDARLVYNDTGIETNETRAQEVRDFVQDLLDAGAPIDAIGTQFHAGQPGGNNFSSDYNQTYNNFSRRINYLAETGLPIEITEFDNFRGQTNPNGSTVNNSTWERNNFEAALRIAFESKNVTGFTMWGFEDNTHWVDNAPLFDTNGNLKPEGQPYFDLVRGQWWTNKSNLSTNANGETSNQVLTKGTYNAQVVVGSTTLSQQLEVTSRFAVLVADLPTNALFLLGDLNKDNKLSVEDGAAFSLALTDQQAYILQYGMSPLMRGDINHDGLFNSDDIQPFLDFFDPNVAALMNVPEPTALVMMSVGLPLILRRRR